jgi:hypothetical protein
VKGEMSENHTPRLHRVVVALLALTSFAPLFAAPAHGAWSTATAIPTPWPFERPVLARDEAGDAVLVWHHDEELETESLSGVEASARSGDGPWSPAVVLSSTHQGGPQFPELVMDASGSATLAWERFPHGDGGPWVEVLRHTLSGGWGPGVRVSPPEAEEASEPRLALAPDGNPTLAFGTSRTGTLVMRRHGGNLRTLRSLRLEGAELQLATDGRGETILAVSQDEEHRVAVLVLSAGGRPEGPVQTFHAGRDEAVGLRLAADRRGDAVLIWRVTGAKRRPLRAVTRKAGGRFSGPVTIAGGTNSEPVVSIDSRGRATVLFTHTGNAPALEWARHRPGARWTSPHPVSGGANFHEPRLGPLPNGDTLAVGTRWPEGVIEAAKLSPGGALEGRMPLSGAERYTPTLVVTANGAATVAWLAPKAIETADYTP